jgi:hypothetical protein
MPSFRRSYFWESVTVCFVETCDKYLPKHFLWCRWILLSYPISSASVAFHRRKNSALKRVNSRDIRVDKYINCISRKPNSIIDMECCELWKLRPVALDEVIYQCFVRWDTCEKCYKMICNSPIRTNIKISLNDTMYLYTKFSRNPLSDFGDEDLGGGGAQQQRRKCPSQ